jgi:hypothetical protein
MPENCRKADRPAQDGTSKQIAEIKCIGITGDPYLLQGVLLDRDLPRSAPAQRAQPHAAFVVARHIAIDLKPGVVLRLGCAAPTLKHGLAGTDRLFLQVLIPRPSALPRRLIRKALEEPEAKKKFSLEALIDLPESDREFSFWRR